MRILATHRALFGRSPLGGRGARTMSETDISRVVEVFETNGVRWALVGAHAIALLTEPRATVDFDFIIEGARLGSVLRDLEVAFGGLDENDIGAAVQLRAIDVDLIRSTNHPLFQVALDELRAIGEWRVPRTEVVIVLKFLAAVSPWRHQRKRRQDVLDISFVCERAGSLDRGWMIELSKLVYPGADNEFRELLEKLDRGDPLTI
jgi:hypothetical protein